MMAGAQVPVLEASSEGEIAHMQSLLVGYRSASKTEELSTCWRLITA